MGNLIKLFVFEALVCGGKGSTGFTELFAKGGLVEKDGVARKNVQFNVNFVFCELESEQIVRGDVHKWLWLWFHKKIMNKIKKTGKNFIFFLLNNV